MIDSTVAHITDPQFKMVPKFVLHYGDVVNKEAFNGLFYWCGQPENFDSWGRDRETGEEWRYSHCVVDDFGVLHPADLFYYGSEWEQFDPVLDWFFNGHHHGLKLESEERMVRVRKVYGTFLIVDAFFNVYRIFEGWDYFNTQKYQLELFKPGPWGNVKKELDFSEVPKTDMHYLYY